MNSIDLSPLYRNSVGFDHFASILNNAINSNTTTTGYPEYDIENVSDNKYTITLAVAGFTRQEIDIKVEKNILTVQAEIREKPQKDYLYKGIRQKSFEQKFNLAEYVEVSGASLLNGLLTISLIKEVPEAMKPKRIEIIDSSENILQHKPEEAA